MINIDYTLFIQLANFLVLLFVLNAVLFKPVLAFVEKREAELKRRKQESEDILGKAKGVLENYETKIESARTDAALIIAEKRKEAMAESSKLIADSYGKMESMITKARGEISAESEAAMAKLRTEAQAMAKSVASKIIRRDVA